MQFLLSASIITLLAFALPAFAQYSSPESAVYDSVGNRWIVSNAGRGTIVERSAAGEVREFATNLAGPKGLCIVGDTLYITDETRIRGYRLSTRAALFNIAVDGSSFLNDAAADDDFLYVSEMVRHRIYRMNLESHQVEAWVTNGVASPNGLYFDGENNRLIVVSMRDNSPIQQIDVSDASVNTIANTDLDDLDGIARDGNGNYYISSWGSNAVYRFPVDFSNQEMLEDGYDGPADIFYDRVNDILAIPCMNVHRVVFRETPPPQAELRTPFLIDFQDVYVHTSLAHTIEWRNSGGEELVIDSISHSGFGFEIECQDNLHIAPGENEQINVVFAPVDSVLYIDTVSIFSTEPLSPRIMILMGTGIAAPWLRVETPYNFLQQHIGSTVERRFWITNSGLADLRIDSMRTSADVFQVVMRGVTWLSRSDTTYCSVSFAPRLRQYYEDTLWIYSNDPLSPTVGLLTGTGILAPTLGDDKIHHFGNVNIGESAAWKVEWVNYGDEWLELDSLRFIRNDAFHAEIPVHRLLAPAETTYSEILFAPRVGLAGVITDTIFVFCNDPLSPRRIFVDGFARTADSVDDNTIPAKYEISEGYPSPFNSRVSFQLSLPGAAQVKISLFDVEGRRIRQIADDRYQAGIHQIGIDGTGLADGVYFLRGNAGPNQFGRKIVFVK